MGGELEAERGTGGDHGAQRSAFEGAQADANSALHATQQQVRATPLHIRASACGLSGQSRGDDHRHSAFGLRTAAVERQSGDGHFAFLQRFETSAAQHVHDARLTQLPSQLLSGRGPARLWRRG